MFISRSLDNVFKISSRLISKKFSANLTYHNPGINTVISSHKANNAFTRCLSAFTNCDGPRVPLLVSNPAITLLSRHLQTKSGDDLKKKVGDSKTAQEDAVIDEKEPTEEKPLSLFQRYKKMAKEYWYVLIPVHVVTSTVWFGMFFYASKSGFDIVPYLEWFEVSETVIRPFRSSSLGHVAIAWMLYKVATPARYTVTLGGTTMTIKILTKRGLIKPMPSKENIKAIYQQKKDEFIQRKTQKN